MYARFETVAVSYRDSILSSQRILCGDDVGEGIPWQEQAMRLSHELERYARFLRDCVGGGYPGPIVFPAWDKEERTCREARKKLKRVKKKKQR